jgi:hypothetical protein
VLGVVGDMVRVVSEPRVVNLPKVASMFPETEALVLIETKRVVALIEKRLEIDATTPELLATSKYASGVESPSPNLPSEVEEKMAKMESELLWNSTSLEKEAPALKSQNPKTLSF